MVATQVYSAELKQALAFRQSAQPRKAAAIYRDILAQQPDHFEANYALGMLCHQGGRNDLAIPLIKKSVAIRPGIFECCINLGMIQRDEGLLANAQVNLESAVALKPDSAKAHVTLGLLLIDRGELDRAAEEIQHGLKLDPENPSTHARMAMLQQIRGDTDAAVRSYRKVIELTPDSGTAHRSLAFLQKQADYTDDIRKMETAFGSSEISDKDRMLLGNALGKVFDDLGQYDKAIDYLHTANRLQRKTFSYSIAKQKAFFDRHKQGLGRAFLRHCQDHAVTDRTPIFVLGMPRSGTSLVEQIIASHPQAYGAGEVEHTRLFVGAVEQFTGKPFPLDISKVSPQLLSDAGRAYIEKLRLNAGQAERVVDKLPHNFLRVGLFAAVMPNAKIILCERNPLDNCLSIYQHFLGPSHGYATDLAELGQYYRLYQHLMDWWEELLPGHMYRVSYEQLVNNTEDQVRRLLEHCELPFHKNCLAFHKTRRQVKTPSEAQVRQPIYRGSMGRWKNYQQHLGPLIEALGVSEC